MLFYSDYEYFFLKYEEKSEVTFECVPGYECKPYTVDVANKTIIYGATTETKKWFRWNRYYDGEEYIYGEHIFGGMYDELQGNTYVLTGIDVSRITGSICIQY